jgi:hypothetical protein
VPVLTVFAVFFWPLAVADWAAEARRAGGSSDWAGAGFVAVALVDGGLSDVGLLAVVRPVDGLARAGLVPEDGARALAVCAGGGAFCGTAFRTAATLAPRRVILTGLP